MPLGSIAIPNLLLSHGSDDGNERLKRPVVFPRVSYDARICRVATAFPARYPSFEKLIKVRQLTAGTPHSSPNRSACGTASALEPPHRRAHRVGARREHRGDGADDR